MRMEIVRVAAAPVAGTGAGSDECAAFDQLVRCHRQRVFRFILASLRDRDDAENLTQDCFVRAYRAFDNFRGDASAVTWLMQIAVNLVRDHQSSSRLKFWRSALRRDVDLEAAEAWLPDGQSSPEEVTAARQKVRAVWSAAARLPAQQRMVFLLRFVEDMDLLDIAAVTGLKEGTVKAHLFRAVHAVRAQFEVSK
jgi:RNA polymerase sigma-70 factor (ECF subfamily)